MPEIRIVIADDHAIVREGLRRLVERDARLAVVGEAGDGESALERITALRPDVAVVDYRMPVQDGVAVTQAVRTARLPTRVVLLTMHNDRGRFNAAIDAGVAGYVLKDSAAAEVVQAIHAVAAGNHYISPALSGFLLKRRSEAAALSDGMPGLGSLTPAERRILRLVADGHTSRAIADALFVSVRTVEDHRATICKKSACTAPTRC